MIGDFFKNKRVLVTGHTGFKGSWLSLWLAGMGAEVYGLALRDGGPEDLYAALPADTFAGETIGDIAEFAEVRRAFSASDPGVVFHLAAQALVRESYRDPRRTVLTNVVGTMNILEALRELERPCTTVVVSSDKCYENLEKPMAYREEDRLGGHDVYSSSKAAADILANAWARSFLVSSKAMNRLAVARAGNVIGGGDYSADRIVPDCVRAIRANRTIDIRKPQALRPWQHVLDCLHGYLHLARWLEESEAPAVEAFNFGPSSDSCHTVGRLVEEFFRSWQGEANFAPRSDDPHEAQTLLLSSQKAILTLGWRPVWDFSKAVAETADWYRKRHEDGDCGREAIVEITRGQIREFVANSRSSSASPA